MKYVLLALVLTLPAQAAESTASAGSGTEVSVSPGSKGGLQKKFEESETITDAKLKADAGSLSRISLKASLAYYGPPVSDLGAKDQPNPDNVVTPTKTAIAGSLGSRFRFDPDTSIALGAGVKNQYPFRSEGTSFTMSNPYLSYDRSFRWLGAQFVASPGVTLVTEETYRNVGEVFGVNAKLNGVYNIGASGFAVGADTSANYYFFNRDYIAPNPAAKTKAARFGDGAVQRLALSIAPNLKYNFSKSLSAITSWGFTLYNPRAQQSVLELRSRLVNQRIGLGYAITRDIYLNPYLQFYPTQFSWSTVTANISTVFSVL